jgi:Tfp pilus assembly protein PilV
MIQARRQRSPRRGYGMIEVAMALVVLATAMMLMVRLLAWTGLERREAGRRALAIQEVSNVMERISLERYDDVTLDGTKAIALARNADEALPGASWQVEVVEEPDPHAPAKRVSIRLRWTHASGDQDHPVALTSWVYRGRVP